MSTMAPEAPTAPTRSTLSAAASAAYRVLTAACDSAEFDSGFGYTPPDTYDADVHRALAQLGWTSEAYNEALDAALSPKAAYEHSVRSSGSWLVDPR